MTNRRRIDVNLDELDQIIDRSQRAPLSESEGEKLKTALHAMAERLLQKRSTEKTSAVLPPDMAAAGKPDPSQSAPAGHGRNPAAAFRGANKVAVTHPTLHSGDTCPECRRGRVYQQKEPARLVRFVGHAPLEATVLEMERLRCNACGEVFTADEPETAGPAKYDETAVAMIALLKYGSGVPFKRLERLQGQLGMPLPATTINDHNVVNPNAPPGWIETYGSGPSDLMIVNAPVTVSSRLQVCFTARAVTPSGQNEPIYFGLAMHASNGTLLDSVSLPGIGSPTLGGTTSFSGGTCYLWSPPTSDTVSFHLLTWNNYQPSLAWFATRQIYVVQLR